MTYTAFFFKIRFIILGCLLGSKKKSHLFHIIRDRGVSSRGSYTPNQVYDSKYAPDEINPGHASDKGTKYYQMNKDENVH